MTNQTRIWQNRRSVILSQDPAVAPPTEFRIFEAGTNRTLHGDFLFDAIAAESVMREYRAHGVDLMVDYDHGSVQPLQVDPSLASKAAAWFGLALRMGELWAVRVTWTPAATAALTSREWRYMSPCFLHDEDGRITRLVNVALTNLPATHDLVPLVASQRKTMSMSADTVKQALDAIESGDTETAKEILKSLIAEAAASAPVDDPAAAAAAAATAADPPPDPAMAAAGLRIVGLLEADSPEEAVTKTQSLLALLADVNARQAKIAADKAAAEVVERRGLVADLVKLGVEIPATAWSDEKGTVPCERLAQEPLDGLRDRIKRLKAARSKPAVTPAVAPVVTPTAVTHAGLDARELAICATHGCDPKTYAMLKSRREAGKQSI